jgi:phosphoesterase RecJ-like protein
MDNKELSAMRKEFKYLEKRIKEEDRIVVYRHVSPDFDALGAQMGLVTWIKENFPKKEVRFVGDVHPTFMPNPFPYPEKLDESWYRQQHLAITVDVSDSKRVSENHLSFAKEVIKLDHHPLPQPEYSFGNFLIVHPDRPAASEILALFFLSRGHKLKLSAKAASYLYTGIVGDTGRFLYEDTDAGTLRLSAALLDCGVDKTAIYDQMYETDLRRMNILKFCLDNFHMTAKGTCYYVFTQKDMDALQMTADEGNLHINTFRTMKGVRCVLSITEDVNSHNFRVSLRSAKIKVAPAALKFDGGGHDFAAGCKLDSLDLLPKLLEVCDELV